MPNIEVGDKLLSRLKQIAQWHGLAGEPDTKILEKLVAEEWSRLKPVRVLANMVNKKIEQIQTQPSFVPSCNEAAKSDVSETDASTSYMHMQNFSKDAIRVKDFSKLTFSNPVIAMISGKLIQRPTWNSLLEYSVFLVSRRTKLTGEELERDISWRSGSKLGVEFNPMKELGFSLQNKDALSCGQKIDRLAERYAFSYRVEFRWTENAPAPYANKIGYISNE